MLHRCALLRGAGSVLLAKAAIGQARAAPTGQVILPFGNGERPLIQLTSRPPQLETPFSRSSMRARSRPTTPTA